MTSPHEPPYVPPPPQGAPPRYRRFWDSLVRERPDVAEEIYAVVTEHTDYEQACDRIAGEALLAISFGLIARCRPDDRQLVSDIGTLYAIRSTGGEVSPEVWQFAHERANELLQDLDPDSLHPAAYTALLGARHAAKPTDDYSLVHLMAMAISAWDLAVDGQHGAVTWWAAEITVSQTKAAGKEPSERP